MTARAPWVLFACILVGGALLRFHALDRQSLWDDEMTTVKDITSPFSAWQDRFSTYEMHPPLYFLQLRVWQKLFGRSLTVWRANSAFWGVVSLAAFFFLARGYLGFAGGLGAMALMASSPYHLAYSQEMRPYALAITGAIFGLLLLEFCLLNSQRNRWWILLGAVWTALLYTHYWGAFVVLAQFSYGWMQAPTDASRKKVVLVAIGCCALFSLWMPILWSQLRYITGLSFWVPPPAPINLARTFIAFTGLFFHHASLSFRAPGPGALNGVLALIYLALLGMGIYRGPRAAGIWLLAGVTLPYLISYRVPGLYVGYRYPSLMYPAFVLLIASGIQMFPKRWLQVLVLATLLVVSSWGCWVYATTWQKANPKAVIAYIDGLKQPGSVVVRPIYFSNLFVYYDQGPTAVIDQDKLDNTEKRAALKGKKIIFVAFDVPDDPVRDALLSEFSVRSSRYFPGYAHLGITVYQLQ